MNLCNRPKTLPYLEESNRLGPGPQQYSSIITISAGLEHSCCKNPVQSWNVVNYYIPTVGSLCT